MNIYISRQQCRSAITPIALQAEKTILRDINTTTIGIASILADLAGIEVDIKRSDSLVDNEASHGVDLVVSNPPIRAGKEVVHEIISGSYDKLVTGGTLTIVIQKKQGAPSAQKKMEEIFGNAEIVTKEKA